MPEGVASGIQFAGAVAWCYYLELGWSDQKLVTPLGTTGFGAPTLDCVSISPGSSAQPDTQTELPVIVAVLFVMRTCALRTQARGERTGAQVAWAVGRELAGAAHR